MWPGQQVRAADLAFQVSHALLLVVKVCLGDEDLIRPGQSVCLVPACTSLSCATREGDMPLGRKGLSHNSSTSS